MHYTGGVAILDNHTGGELSSGDASMMDLMDMLGGGGARPRVPRVVGPEGRAVMRYLQAGGNVLLGTSSATRAIWDSPLYRDTLGLEYARTWNRSYGFSMIDAAGKKDGRAFEIDVARKGDAITVFAPRENIKTGVTPFAVLPDGQWIGARVVRTDPDSKKEYRAIVLGFYLNDVKGDENRRGLLKEALAFLAPKATMPIVPIEARDSRPAKDQETPVGASTTGGGGR